jgi:Fn3 domain-containing protein
VDHVADAHRQPDLLYSTEMLQTLAWCECRGGELPVAATPTIAPESSTASEDSVLVDISSTTPGATLYYTIDGTDPDESSLVATGPVELTTDHFAGGATVTVKAIAAAPGFQDSAIGSAVIHANPNP